MLEFRELTSASFGKFRDSIMSSELEFHPNIRTGESDYRNILSSQKCVGVIALLGSNYLGNALGSSPSEGFISEECLEGVSADSAMIYLFNLVIDAKHRNKGYGTLLLDEFISRARKQGFKKLLGHFNRQSSRLVMKLGGKMLSEHPDWMGTGEKYFLYELKLR